MALVFNGNLLTPNGIIQSDWESFVDIFVTKPNMQKHFLIFEEYKKYLADLRTVLGETSFIQWINGSFVTKKTNPNDIDIVTFLPIEILQKVENRIDHLKPPQVGINYKLIDAYIVPLSKEDQSAWLWEFSRVRGKDGKTLSGQSKGFIELTF